MAWWGSLGVASATSQASMWSMDMVFYAKIHILHIQRNFISFKNTYFTHSQGK